MMVQVRKYIFFSLMLTSLVGCGGDQEDLHKYVSSVKSRPPGKIQPIPEFKKQKTKNYQSKTYRSPFKKLVIEKKDPLMPDKDRPKEPLEAFQLDSLKMVGSLSSGEKTQALVLAPNSTVYIVKVGSYLGTNYGRIVKITPKEIEMRETIPDKWGKWKKRTAILKLEKGE